MTTVLPDPPRSALVDPRTGQLAREWVLFFDALRRAIVSGLDDQVGGRLDQLEADSLFAGSDGGGSNTDYNDAVVRGRLDSIETELLWLGTDRVEAQTDQSGTETDLSDLFTPSDSTADIRRLKRAIRDLETAQAMVTDQTGLIAAIVHRLQALETEGAFP